MTTDSQTLLENLQHCNDQLWQLLLNQAPSQQAMQDSINQDWSALWQQQAQQPARMLEHQLHWWQQQLQLLQQLCLGDLGSSPLVAPERGDRRFSAPQWQHPWFNYIKQSYLLASQEIQASLDQQPGLTPSQQQRLRFHARQMLNALSPSNFLGSNPELLSLTLDTGGRNLVQGLARLSQDLQRSGAQLNVTMTDTQAYRLGRDLATTPGKVVFENALLQLIQYHPSTEQVCQRPILMVPAFINKYYILDLQPHNSMVRALVEQGHTVFMISWVNPDHSHRHLDFDDYVVDGVMAALTAIEAQTGEKEVNGVGYCIGGTLLAATMAYMTAKRLKRRIQSASLFTTLLDFSTPGEIGHFLNDATVEAIARQNQTTGLMDGRQLAVSFAMLRENQLYWNYFVDGYLKGKSPVAFDLLHWNCDSTNLPGPCHTTLVRRLYWQNALIQKGQFHVKGTSLDLGRVTAPSFTVATREDHIALWPGCYQSMQALGGNKTFVLGESGHIAGIINPENGKYGHFRGELAETPEQWLQEACHHQGSWWSHWHQWLKDHNPATVVDARHPAAEFIDAPGSYVQVRLDETKGEESHHEA